MLGGMHTRMHAGCLTCSLAGGGRRRMSASKSSRICSAGAASGGSAEGKRVWPQPCTRLPLSLPICCSPRATAGRRCSPATAQGTRRGRRWPTPAPRPAAGREAGRAPEPLAVVESGASALPATAFHPYKASGSCRCRSRRHTERGSPPRAHKQAAASGAHLGVGGRQHRARHSRVAHPHHARALLPKVNPALGGKRRAGQGLASAGLPPGAGPGLAPAMPASQHHRSPSQWEAAPE